MTSLDVSSQWSQGHPAPPYVYIVCNRNLSDRCKYCKGKGWCKGAVVCQWLYIAGLCGTAWYSSTSTHIGGGTIANSGSRNSIGRDMCWWNWLLLVISERKGKSLTPSSIHFDSGWEEDQRIPNWQSFKRKGRWLCVQAGCSHLDAGLGPMQPWRGCWQQRHLSQPCSEHEEWFTGSHHTNVVVQYANFLLT